MLNESQTQAYLDRIAFDGTIAHSKETLDGLVYAHQTHIPFETISLHRSGHTPSLDTDDLYIKVVEKRLGGYCFELNKLFGELLVELGFKARPVLSRAVRGREGRMPINHRGIIVNLDGNSFSADVGFGGPMPAGALLLADGSDQIICGETYATKSIDHAWWKIERQTQAHLDSFDDNAPVRRQVELELCTASTEEQDFDALNEFFAKPGTLFRDHEIANLRTPNGSAAYKDGVLTVRTNGVKEVREIPPAEVDAVLADVFGLENIAPSL